MVRHPCCEKMGVKKGPWTPEEDRILISYIERYGHQNWRALPKQAGLLRCGKSCRLRWINYLRPDIKRGNFSKEEEETIIKLHEMLGNRWSAIATKLPGRTDNEIKNYWNTHLKKRGEHNQLIRSTFKRSVTTLKWRSHDDIHDSDYSEWSSPYHLTLQKVADFNSISAEAAISNSLQRSDYCSDAVTTTRYETNQPQLCSAKPLAVIAGGNGSLPSKDVADQFSSAESKFHGGANPRLVFQSPIGFASVAEADSGSNISNDMYFWYNIFINAGKSS